MDQQEQLRRPRSKVQAPWQSCPPSRDLKDDKGKKALLQHKWRPVVFDAGCIGEGFVRDTANLASSGNIAHLEIGDFLSSGRGSEHQELLCLIGTLLDDKVAHL